MDSYLYEKILDYIREEKEYKKIIENQNNIIKAYKFVSAFDCDSHDYNHLDTIKEEVTVKILEDKDQISKFKTFYEINCNINYSKRLELCGMELFEYVIKNYLEELKEYGYYKMNFEDEVKMKTYSKYNDEYNEKMDDSCFD